MKAMLCAGLGRSCLPPGGGALSSAFRFADTMLDKEQVAIWLSCVAVAKQRQSRLGMRQNSREMRRPGVRARVVLSHETHDPRSGAFGLDVYAARQGRQEGSCR